MICGCGTIGHKKVGALSGLASVEKYQTAICNPRDHIPRFVVTSTSTCSAMAGMKPGGAKRCFANHLNEISQFQPAI